MKKINTKSYKDSSTGRWIPAASVVVNAGSATFKFERTSTKTTSTKAEADSYIRRRVKAA
ncbi:MAG: hypothetical protein ACJKSS_02285 [Patescibacteria group bacterium UBA2103]